MSVSDIHRLTDDALLEIFSYLDADELWNCEKVCVGWQNVISCETLWKKIFLRKIKKDSDTRWRNVCERLSKLDNEYKNYSFKRRFQILYNKIEQLDRNWRSGTFTKNTVLARDRISIAKLDMDDDYIIEISFLRPILVFERTNMTLRGSIDGLRIDTNNIISHNLIFCQRKQSQNRVTVVDAHSCNQICEIFDPRERKVGGMCINSRKQLTVLGYFPGTEHLTVWKMEGPTDYRPIHQEYFNGLNREVWSDEDFVVLAFAYRPHFGKFEVRLISTTTFETERSFGFREAVFHYDRGLLFVVKRSDDIIRIMEAKTGQWIRNIYLKSITSHIGLSRTAILIRLNSTFMVTVTEQPHPEWESTLHVYDLEAIRNPRRAECLITTIRVPKLRFLGIAIDETQIVFTGGKLLEDDPQHLTVLDFLKSFP